MNRVDVIAWFIEGKIYLEVAMSQANFFKNFAYLIGGYMIFDTLGMPTWWITVLIIGYLVWLLLYFMFIWKQEMSRRVTIVPKMDELCTRVEHIENLLRLRRPKHHVRR